MNDRRDLIRGWAQKAESDLRIVELCLANGTALDAACFHSQQAAEKMLKAYLIAKGVEFPFIHDLAKLIRLCADGDPEFASIRELGTKLTPYAVELRYDNEFWPTPEVAAEAGEAAGEIRAFVLSRMPAEMRPEGLG